MGLPIVRHLVEIHGGNIKAESDGAGKGATFRVRLPQLGPVANLNQQEETDEVVRESLTSEFRLNGIHVLLVNDAADTLHLMSAALAQGKAHVTAVSSAKAAMKRLCFSRPDVVVSDIAMPDEDGYQLIRKIRALDLDLEKPLPAIAITAYGRRKIVRGPLTPAIKLIWQNLLSVQNCSQPSPRLRRAIEKGNPVDALYDRK